MNMCTALLCSYAHVVLPDKGRQDLGKVDTPSNKGKQEGRQGERQDLRKAATPYKRETRRETRGDKATRPWESGHTIQQR
jgi:hypothetical protein